MKAGVFTVPDEAAQELWQQVCDVSDRIAELMDHIPAETVNGRQTRDELHEAYCLLVRAENILRQAAAREVPRFETLDRRLRHEVRLK